MLFVTAYGHIGKIINMGEQLALHMTALQRNISKMATDVVNTQHTK